MFWQFTLVTSPVVCPVELVQAGISKRCVRLVNVDEICEVFYHVWPPLFTLKSQKMVTVLWIMTISCNNALICRCLIYRVQKIADVSS